MAVCQWWYVGSFRYTAKYDDVKLISGLVQVAIHCKQPTTKTGTRSVSDLSLEVLGL